MFGVFHYKEQPRDAAALVLNLIEILICFISCTGIYIYLDAANGQSCTTVFGVFDVFHYKEQPRDTAAL